MAGVIEVHQFIRQAGCLNECEVHRRGNIVIFVVVVSIMRQRDATFREIECVVTVDLRQSAEQTTRQ